GERQVVRGDLAGGVGRGGAQRVVLGDARRSGGERVDHAGGHHHQPGPPVREARTHLVEVEALLRNVEVVQPEVLLAAGFQHGEGAVDVVAEGDLRLVDGALDVDGCAEVEDGVPG